MCVYEKDNDKHFIDAINSLKLNKEYIDQTIIVINGYISDFKREVIKKNFDELKITSIEIPINLGLSRALNIGLQKVKSDWVARFDSDDLCLPNRFKIMKEIILNYEKKFDVIGTYIEEFNEYEKTKVLRKTPTSLKKIKKRILFSNPINHVSVIFKTSLIKKISGKDFYPLIDGFEDYALWIKLLKNKIKMTNLPFVSVYVRADDDMLNRRGGIKYIFGEIKFRILILKYISFWKYPENLLCALFRILVFSSPIFVKRLMYKIKRNF